METGACMDSQDARKVTDEQIRVERFSESEVVHDYTGQRYIINSDYVKQQLEQRTNSVDKEIALAAIRHLLHSDVQELTNRQKDVMIGIMEGKTFREIAIEMGIHYTTVQEHVSVAKEKLEKLINQTKGVISHGTDDTDKADVDSKEGNRESGE